MLDALGSLVCHIAVVDRILLTVPKGEKEVIQRAASAAGVSLNAYIRGAVSDRIQREQGNAPAASDNAPESL